MYSKEVLFDKAIELAKEYAKSGGPNPAGVLTAFYEELKKLNADTQA